jgi:hypothetical protein
MTCNKFVKYLLHKGMRMRDIPLKWFYMYPPQRRTKFAKSIRYVQFPIGDVHFVRITEIRAGILSVCAMGRNMPQLEAIYAALCRRVRDKKGQLEAQHVYENLSHIAIHVSK